jgi:hypothetical protein
VTPAGLNNIKSPGCKDMPKKQDPAVLQKDADLKAAKSEARIALTNHDVPRRRKRRRTGAGSGTTRIQSRRGNSAGRNANVVRRNAKHESTDTVGASNLRSCLA